MRPTALGTAQPRHCHQENRTDVLNSPAPSPSSIVPSVKPPQTPPSIGASPGSAAGTRRFAVVDNAPAHIADHRWSSGELSDPLHAPVSQPLAGDDDGRAPFDPLLIMEPTNTKFYQLGNGGSLVFERDLDALSEYLERPHPEFHGTQVNDQPGGELQWVITADLRGKMEPPTSERILFSIRESNWLDGLACALQEALARLYGHHVTELQGTRFVNFARHDTIVGPMALSSHPVLKHHVEHLDFMLHKTQKELDNARVYANQTHLALAQHADAIRMLAKDRKSLRQQRAKKGATIARLRAKIVSLEATVKAQEDQLREMEEEGEDIQEGEAFLSDDDDFEEDENTDVEDYEFLEATEDDIIPIDVDDEE
ncbi:hypothetical protein QYE76_041270 [Lolium multiflorum]|uniref:Uncharacterized protein n=1 Tax=Lolium multiflorum TaxID=4521 RepID=A0AAD8TEM6_LOLMU|nr:hypothetical protein QYE76_041270 [Lolium multiflorum]